jgi:uncharacterized protein (TIGR03546 family)
MLSMRNVASFLRGKATPTQVFLAVLLGTVLGFVPGFLMPGAFFEGLGQAPGLIASVLMLALVLQCNLGLLLLAATLGKALSLALIDVCFATGQLLLDGPLQSLFAAMVNAPVLAWFGLDYYATAGGLLVGALLGTLAGMLLVLILRSFRSRMANLEESSEKYRKLTANWLIRLTTWLLLGSGKGKKLRYEDLLSRRSGLPVRLSGLAVVAVLAGAFWLSLDWISSPVLTRSLRTTLTAANGATVDLDRAALNLGDASLQIDGLAVADRSQLDRDVFAADSLRASIDVDQLLRRRWVVGELLVQNARSGSARPLPGTIHLPPQAPPPVEPTPDDPDPKTIDDYLQEIEVWHQRLEQVAGWIETVVGPHEAESEPTPESRADEVAQKVRELGKLRVRAGHLLRQAPTIWIRTVTIADMNCITLDGESLSIDAADLSSEPWLLDDPPRVQIRSKSPDRLTFDLVGPAAGQAGCDVSLAVGGIPVDDVMRRLSVGELAPLQGGTMALRMDGALHREPTRGTVLSMPLEVRIEDTTFQAFGSKPTKVSALALPIGIDGPLRRPRVRFETARLTDALVAAGQRELANNVRNQAGKLLDKISDDGRQAIEGLLDKDKSPDQVKQDLEQKLKDAGKQAEQKLKQGLRKLLPGGG